MLLSPQRNSGSRNRSVAMPLACAFAAVILAGCSSTSMNSLIDGLPKSVGLPADAPERPAEPLVYPAVHDMPPARSNTTLTAEEQLQLEKELIATQRRHDAMTGAAPAAQRRAKPTEQQSPPRAIPASSGASIY